MENSTRISKEPDSINRTDLIFSLACLFIYFVAVLTVFCYENYENSEPITSPNLEILNSGVNMVNIQGGQGFGVFIGAYTDKMTS